jgi:hypothetical protein
MQRLARPFEQIDRGEPASFEHVAEVVQRWHEIAHGFDDIGLEVAAPRDPFLGQQIDQDDRPLGQRSDASDDGSLELEDDGACGDASYGQRSVRHGGHRGFDVWDEHLSSRAADEYIH